MQTCAAIPRWQVDQGMLFITLTYPGQFAMNDRVWKRDLDRFLKRLRRKFPGVGGVWKLEPQERGAPHYHLVIVGVSFIAKEWLSQAWYEVVGSEDPKHLVAGTQVQQVQSYEGVLSYAAKYASKGLQELPEEWLDGVGRWWGVFGRENLAILRKWMRVSEREWFAARRFLVGLLIGRDRQKREAERRRTGWVKPPGKPPPMGSRFHGKWLMLSDQAVARYLDGVTFA